MLADAEAVGEGMWNPGFNNSEVLQAHWGPGSPGL